MKDYINVQPKTNRPKPPSFKEICLLVVISALVWTLILSGI